MKRLAVTLACLFLLVAGTAHAQTILAPPQGRPFAAYGGLGGALSAKDSAHQFALMEGFVWHFSGRFDGPAIAVEIQEGFGNSVIFFQGGPRFVWDIQPVSTLALLLSPSIGLGGAYASVSGEVCHPLFGCQSVGGGGGSFNLQIAFEGKLVLAQRAFVSFRPFALDFYIRGEGVSIRYNLLFGGGAIF